MNPQPNKYYWAWYECRLTIITPTNDLSGFIAFGQDAIWGWSNAEIICEAEMPDQVKRERDKYIDKRISNALNVFQAGMKYSAKQCDNYANQMRGAHVHTGASSWAIKRLILAEASQLKELPKT